MRVLIAEDEEQIASHELKTPITVISANAELLEAIGEENEWTRNIREQTVRMTDLVNELVTLSKLSEVEKPAVTGTDLSEIVSRSASDIKPVIIQRGKRLERDIAADIRVMGEHKLLTMLANILIENASKYCDEGGMIRTALEARRKTALFTVSNDYAAGAEVDPGRFFERFYQEDSPIPARGRPRASALASPPRRR